jgi:hypothetical protein
VLQTPTLATVLGQVPKLLDNGDGDTLAAEAPPLKMGDSEIATPGTIVDPSFTDDFDACIAHLRFFVIAR